MLTKVIKITTLHQSINIILEDHHMTAMQVTIETIVQNRRKVIDQFMNQIKEADQAQKDQLNTYLPIKKTRVL